MGDVIERLQPPLVVTSFGHTPGRSSRGYVSVWDAFPSIQLLMRESVFAELFDRLLQDWRRPRPGHAGPGHPFHSAVEVVTDTTAIPWQGGETPSLRLDFDEIAFRFASTHSDLAVAQLVIDGQVVFQSSSERRVRPATGGGPPSLGPVDIIWPVRPWRGHSGVVRFIDVAPAPHFLSAGDIRSLRDAGATVPIDDFETGSFGAAWEEVFTGGPYPLRELAARRGVAFATSDWAALSLDRPGAQKLRTRPFVLDRGQISMVVFDLGKGGEVELAVDGKRRRLWRSRGSRRLVPLTWDVSRWRGHSAVLEVRDGDPAPEKAIGVDEIVLFDRAR
jgi:hypothetical protein